VDIGRKSEVEEGGAHQEVSELGGGIKHKGDYWRFCHHRQRRKDEKRYFNKACVPYEWPDERTDE